MQLQQKDGGNPNQRMIAEQDESAICCYFGWAKTSFINGQTVHIVSQTLIQCINDIDVHVSMSALGLKSLYSTDG